MCPKNIPLFIFLITLSKLTNFSNYVRKILKKNDAESSSLIRDFRLRYQKHIFANANTANQRRLGDIQT